MKSAYLRSVAYFDSISKRRSDRFSLASSDTFVRKTNGKRRATRRYRNKRWDEHRPGFSGFGSFVISIATMDDARNALPRTPRAARTRGHRTSRRWKDSTTMEEWQGRIGWRENDRLVYRMEKSTTRAPTDVQAHDGLTSAWKNPQFEMAVGWECLYIGKTCSDLFPRCSNKVRFTIGQQLFRAAIAPKTRGRNDASPSFACPFLLHVDGKHGFRSFRSKEQIFLLEFRR